MAIPSDTLSPLTALATSPLTLQFTSPIRPAALRQPPPSVSSSSERSYTTSPGSSPSRRAGHARKRRRLSDYDKLSTVLSHLQRYRWSIRDLLAAMMQYRHKHRIRRMQQQFLEYAYVELMRDKNFEEYVGSERKQAILRSQGWKWVKDSLSAELLSLIDRDLFGSFEPPTEENEFGNLDFLEAANSNLSSLAPAWFSILEPPTLRSSLPSSSTQPTNNKYIFMILSVLCHQLKPKVSNTFQNIMGLYVYQGGARRRVLETLSRLGLTMSYRTLRRRMDDLTNDAQQRVRTVGKASTTVLTYDNFDFAEGRRGERIGDLRAFRSITTALLFRGQGLGGIPLHQGMWQPHLHPLSALDIAKQFMASDVERQVRH